MTNRKDNKLRYNLVFIGDDIWHKDQYETWLPFVNRLVNSYPAFTYSKISDQFSESHLVKIQDKMKRLEVILHSSDGAIIWRETGDCTAAKAESLDGVLMNITELFDDFY